MFQVLNNFDIFTKFPLQQIPTDTIKKVHVFGLNA